MSGAPIQPAPPTYAGDAATNEKHEYMHAGSEQQQFNSAAQPQQPYPQHATEPQQTAYKQDVPPQSQAPGNSYQNVTPLTSLQQGPAPVDCPMCGKREMTRTEYVSGDVTHVSALLLCCVACLGCIPYMASFFKDVEHKCGSCGALLAVWHRSGRTEVLAHGRA